MCQSACLLSISLSSCCRLSACSLDDDADDYGDDDDDDDGDDDDDDNEDDADNGNAEDDGMNRIPDCMSVPTSLIHQCRLGAVHVHVPSPHVFVLILQHVL